MAYTNERGIRAVDHLRNATAEMAAQFHKLFVNRRAYTLQSFRPHLGVRLDGKLLHFRRSGQCAAPCAQTRYRRIERGVLLRQHTAVPHVQLYRFELVGRCGVQCRQWLLAD
jgi:hypothetical protein